MHDDDEEFFYWPPQHNRLGRIVAIMLAFVVIASALIYLCVA